MIEQNILQDIIIYMEAPDRFCYQSIGISNALHFADNEYY